MPAPNQDNDEETDLVDFHWEILQITEITLKFQIVWDNPYKISTGSSRDTLNLELDLSYLDSSAT